MDDLISRQALYEKTAEWEARALAVVEKMNRKPFEEMDANEITEWRKWSCILGERSAFKHDVADAPAIELERKKGKWINCISSEYWKCSCCGVRASYWFSEENSSEWDKDMSEWLSDYCPSCGARMEGSDGC